MEQWAYSSMRERPKGKTAMPTLGGGFDPPAAPVIPFLIMSYSPRRKMAEWAPQGFPLPGAVASG